MNAPLKRRRTAPLGRLAAGGLTSAAVVVVAILVTSISIIMTGAPKDAVPRTETVEVRSAFYAGCGKQAAAEPSTVPLWCTSTDQRLENLAWVSWGGARSVATGLLTDNPCDCASGKVTDYPVEVSFSDPTPVGAVERYQRLSIRFAADRPLWASRATMHFLWGDLGFVSDQERP